MLKKKNKKHWASLKNLSLGCALESPRGFGKTQTPGPHLSRSGVGLRMCISNKFPGDSDVAGPGPHFENHRAMKAVLLKPGSTLESPWKPQQRRIHQNLWAVCPRLYFSPLDDSNTHPEFRTTVLR